VLHLPEVLLALQPPSQAQVQVRAPRAAQAKVKERVLRAAEEVYGKRKASPQAASWSSPACEGQDAEPT